MNKQEFQQKMKNMKRPKFFTAEAYEAGFEEAKRNALFNPCFLAEPEKPVVPQFVADWYEENKNDFEYSLYRLCINFHERKLYGDLYEWFRFDKNKPIETLILMHKFGYEVKKEKLYIAINKTTGEHLYFNNAKKRFESGTLLTSYAKKVKAYHHTQDKLEELNYWENPLFEIEEV